MGWGKVAGTASVGFCTADEETAWVHWAGLEQAVWGAGRCAGREPGVFAAPGCPLFEATTESAVKSYPESCVYYQTSCCPLAVRG